MLVFLSQSGKICPINITFWATAFYQILEICATLICGLALAGSDNKRGKILSMQNAWVTRPTCRAACLI